MAVGDKKNKIKLYLIVTVIIVAVVLFFGGFQGFGSGGFGNCPMGHGLNNSPLMAGLGWIIMVLFVVALVLFIMWVIKQLQEGNKK